MGVEPTSQAWEARVLPMYYTRTALIFINFVFVSKFCFCNFVKLLNCEMID